MNIFNHKNKDKKRFKPVNNIPQIVYGPPEFFKDKNKKSIKNEKSKKDNKI